MTDTSHSRTLAETLEAMAALTPAQHALLERISQHAAPVTVAELRGHGLVESCERVGLQEFVKVGQRCQVR